MNAVTKVHNKKDKKLFNSMKLIFITMHESAHKKAAVLPAAKNIELKISYPNATLLNSVSLRSASVAFK